MGRDTVQLETAVSTISQEYLLEFTFEYDISEGLHPELPGDMYSVEDVVLDTTTTEVALKVNLEREVTAMGPLVNKRRRKRDQSETEVNIPPKVLRTDHASVRHESHTRGGKSLATMGLGAGSTIPTPIPQETPADVIGPDPLSYARLQSIPERDIA
ncbi:hypothetical protein Tco_0792534 [Tanacetum coccineum]